MEISPKEVVAAMAKEWKIKFQNNPVALPNAKRPSFLLNVPFNWKVSETKSALKIKSVAVDWRLTKRKEARRHSIIASTKSPMAKPLMVFT